MTKTVANTLETRVLGFVGGAAAIALAAAPAVSRAQTARIYFGDLNLATPAGAAAFNARVDEAAKDVCSTYGPALSRLRTCRDDVREEAVSRLVAPQRHALALAAAERTHARREAQGF